MAYTIDDFPFETDNPQIEVALPVGTHVLELVVEDSAGLRSLPDTVVITVEREEIPDAEITAIEPVSGLQGATFNASISGTGFAEATAVTFYTQTSITRPTLPTRSTLPTILTGPIISPTRPAAAAINILDNSITAEITARSETGIKLQISVSRTASPGTRTFSVTTPQGVIYSKALTFTVRGIITPTITIPTITIPTVTIPTLTIPTIPTLTIPTLTIPTVTRPTLTIPTVTIPTVTRPTLTIPTVTIPTVTRPTLTIPTVTIPTVTRPTLTIPTVIQPTLTRPTVTIPTIIRPTVVLPTGITPIIREGLDLTSVRGVGAATVDKLKAAGISTVAALAKADAKKVAKTLGFQDITRAQAMIDDAARLIG